MHPNGMTGMGPMGGAQMGGMSMGGMPMGGAPMGGTPMGGTDGRPHAGWRRRIAPPPVPADGRLRRRVRGRRPDGFADGGDRGRPANGADQSGSLI